MIGLWQPLDRPGAATIPPRSEIVMTNEQAIQQAKRRWGQQGYVRHEPGAVRNRFSVGIQDGVLFHVKGVGKKRLPWRTAKSGSRRRLVVRPRVSVLERAAVPFFFRLSSWAERGTAG